MDRQQVTLLVLLYLSAAFDTIDHQVQLSRLRLSFGIRGYALEWIASYLSDRTERVSFENNFSQSRYLSCGVPQDHASVRCYSQCMRASSLTSSKVIFLGHTPMQMTLSCIYILSLTIHLLKATQWTLRNAVSEPSDVE